MKAIEALHPGRLVEHVERLGHHAMRGEMWDKALPYLRQAGARALDRSAYPEAAGYFEQALTALTHLPEAGDMREQALDLRLSLRSALLPANDSARILAHLREAEALAVALGDSRRLGQIAGSSPCTSAAAAPTRRPSPPPSAGSRSGRAAATWCCRRWRTCSSAPPRGRRATTARPSMRLTKTADALDGPSRHQRFRASRPARRAVTSLSRRVLCGAGAVRLEGEALTEEDGLAIAED